MEMINNRRLNQREGLHVDADGNVTIQKVLDATPIIEAVKMSSEIEAPFRNDRGYLHLGSIDPLTAANWAKECGCAIATKEFNEYAKKKLMSGEFAHFRVKRKARLI